MAETCPNCAAKDLNVTTTEGLSASEWMLRYANERARADKAEREAHDALINLDESEECSAELFELCCDVLDGKPNAEKARNELREHVEHVRKCRRGSCAVAIRGSQKARADKAERERDEARAAWRDSQNVHTAFCDAPATRASRDRLLDALRKIAEAPCNCEPYQDGQHRHDCQRISWMVTDAAAALEEIEGVKK